MRSSLCPCRRQHRVRGNKPLRVCDEEDKKIEFLKCQFQWLSLEECTMSVRVDFEITDVDLIVRPPGVDIRCIFFTGSGKRLSQAPGSSHFSIHVSSFLDQQPHSASPGLAKYRLESCCFVPSSSSARRAA